MQYRAIRWGLVRAVPGITRRWVLADRRRSRRTFGSIRRLPSGRFQASYTGPDGLRHNAPLTFATRLEADAWLATIQADVVREMWRMPKRSGMTLSEFAERCIRQRPVKESTRTRYAEIWNAYIDPYVGGVIVEDVTPEVVRTWYADLGNDLASRSPQPQPGSLPRRTGRATLAHAYRILHLVMNVAVEDGLIPSNPCRIKGGGSFKAAERPVLTVEQAEDLASRVPERYRALVYVLTWSALRLGEAAELRRSDIDIKGRRLRVDRAVYPVPGKGYVVDTPKSHAGRRTVHLPGFVMDELAAHMDRFTLPDGQALTFPTRSGRCAYDAAQTAITRALRDMGLSDVRVHDLRHTGQQFAAAEGASLADLMQRLGHSTVNAAMVYAHSSAKNDRRIAEKMGQHRARVVKGSRRPE